MARVSTAIRFPVDLHERLTAAAAARNISLNELVVACCEFGHPRLTPPSSMFVSDDRTEREATR